MRHRHSARSGRRTRVLVDRSEQTLFFVAAAFISACLLLTGGAVQWGIPLLIVAALGTTLLAIAIWRGGAEQLRRLPWDAQAALLLIVLAPPLQLIPLPPAMWHALPGRDLVTDLLTSIGVANQWRPLTLDIPSTLVTAAMALWMLGLFMAVLTLSPPRLRQLVILVLGIAVLHILVGSVQVISRGTKLILYSSSQNGFLSGLFANKNHSGLFIAIAMTWGLWLIPPERLIQRSTLFYLLPLLLLVLLVEFATNSRAGLVLACGGMLGMVVLHFGKLRPRYRRTAIVTLIVVIALGAALWSTPLAEHLLGRFSYVQSDLRFDLWARTLPMIRETFPAGAGFGSFPQLYAAQEHIAWLRPTYANHAHDDYLELLLEAGILGAAILGLTFLALIRASAHAWPRRRSPEGRLAMTSAIVIALVLAHSVVDYPLRRLGIMAVFAMALAMLFAPRTPADHAIEGDSDNELEAGR